MSKLTIKQRKFADEYIISGNATDAYKKAGYKWASDNIASVEGHKLLKKPKVDEYIKYRMEKHQSPKIADQTEILEFLTSAMRGEVTEPILKNSGDFEQIIVDVKPNVSTRKSAAELLGKRYGMWVDKQDVTTNNVTEIVWDIPLEDER
ncbi:terminase small subunit [Streptococcus pluranimalium]|uniref:Terminase small subunit n=1 Tax=Streptococcus pluranimalium TaxID=82348 RepID=A0A345VII9_9STRE|nr:terminase small subunit [Streptococcus pluranimalium]AXJ12541.1 hypothetical protein Sp14A_06120 [Streptococcus pluranimalium]